MGRSRRPKGPNVGLNAAMEPHRDSMEAGLIDPTLHSLAESGFYRLSDAYTEAMISEAVEKDDTER